MLSITPELNNQAPVSNDLKCRFCNNKYVRPSALQKHEEKKHGLEAVVDHPDSPTNTIKKKQDGVYNFTHQTNLVPRALSSAIFKMADAREKTLV